MTFQPWVDGGNCPLVDGDTMLIAARPLMGKPHLKYLPVPVPPPVFSSALPEVSDDIPPAAAAHAPGLPFQLAASLSSLLPGGATRLLAPAFSS